MPHVAPRLDDVLLPACPRGHQLHEQGTLDLPDERDASAREHDLLVGESGIEVGTRTAEPDGGLDDAAGGPVGQVRVGDGAADGEANQPACFPLEAAAVHREHPRRERGAEWRPRGIVFEPHPETVRSPLANVARHGTVAEADEVA